MNAKNCYAKNCYCQYTKLSGPCPVCGNKATGVGPNSPPPTKLDKKTLKAMGATGRASAQAKPVQPAPEPGPWVSNVANLAQSIGKGPMHLALREAARIKDYNTMAAICVGLAGGPEKLARLNAIAQMDAYGQEHGQLTPAMLNTRKSICDECIIELEYNPRTHDAPGVLAGVMYKAQPAVTVQGPQASPTPPAYDASRPMLAPPRGPLKAGDWADLWRRVKAGEITEAEATAFGQLWTGGGKAN